MTQPRLITLSRTQFLYVAAVLLIVLPVVVAMIVSPSFAGVWCRQFELPAYESAFGFRMGSFELPGDGERHSVPAIVTVDPGGAMARAGVRPGDIPPLYHGFGDFCSDLEAASRGEVVELRLANVADVRAGLWGRRSVTLRLER